MPFLIPKSSIPPPSCSSIGITFCKLALTGFNSSSSLKVVILGLLGWLMYLNWQLTMIAFVLIPMVALAVGAFSRRMRRLSGEQLRYTGELTGVVGEAIHGNPVIKVYAGQEHERRRFASASGQLRAFARRMTVASALIVPITQVMAAVAVAVVIGIALYQSQQDHTTVGGFVSLSTTTATRSKTMPVATSTTVAKKVTPPALPRF